MKEELKRASTRAFKKEKLYMKVSTTDLQDLIYDISYITSADDPSVTDEERREKESHLKSFIYGLMDIMEEEV